MQNKSHKLTRLAPTPSGFLHLGNAYSFLLTRLLADQLGLKILLRIDDLDRARFREEYLDDIFHTLELLQLDYDFGPRSVRDFQEKWSQSHRENQYESALNTLKKQNSVFACQCSRKEVRQNSTDGSYPGTCQFKNLDFNAPEVCWRIIPSGKTLILKDGQGSIRQALLPSKMKFSVVRRKDGIPAYHLASVVDDLHFGITHIVRGQDLWTSTLAQLDLAQWLEPSFSKSHFIHHPILKSEEGKKLSKSQSAPSVSRMLKSASGKREVFKLFSQTLQLQSVYTNLPDLRQALSSGEERLVF